MILTINYTDLQNIKQQMLNNKITDNKQIYTFIKSYKDTLNHMYKNKLVQNRSKLDYEFELMKFANEMLKNTDVPYREIEKKYGLKTTKDYIVCSKDIRLIL